MMTAIPAPADRLRQLVQRARRVSIALLTVCALIVAQLVAEGHDQQRVVELLFLAAAVGVLVANVRRHPLVLPGARVAGALLLFFALGIASSLMAASPVHGLLEVGMWWLLLLVAMGGAGELAHDDGSGQLLVLQTVGAGIGLYFLKVAAAVGVALATRSPMDLLLFAPSFSNYRFLNHGQTITLPLLALLCLLAPGKQRRLWFCVAACWWSLLFLLGGRGTMVGLACGAVVVLWCRRRDGFAYLRLLALTALTGALVYLLLFVALPVILGMAPFGSISNELNRTMADPGSGRARLWQAALTAIPSHPWFGAGPMHYAHELAPRVFYAHPHDWVLQVAHEWGLPALAALCAILGLVWRRLLAVGRTLAHADAANQAALSAWILGAVAIVVDSMVSGLLVMPVSQLGIVLYLACAAGWVQARRGGAAPVRAGHGALVAVTVLALLLAAGAAWQTMPAPDNDRFNPRFWLRGEF